MWNIPPSLGPITGPFSPQRVAIPTTLSRPTWNGRKISNWAFGNNLDIEKDSELDSGLRSNGKLLWRF
jgi:hypothetical protein